tara:strand:+ start:129 stop:599 length:471 start_codon:yes stop_codon:yes gene_type:complete
VRKAVSLGLLIAVTGCTSSGVVPMGPDTYLISTTSEISPAYAKKSALKEASQYCISQVKEVMPVSTDSGSHRDAFGDNLATFDYTFRCLSKNDNSLARPEIKNKAVDININHSSSGNSQISQDVYNALLKLGELRDKGILTQDEFEQQKDKVLRQN